MVRAMSRDLDVAVLGATGVTGRQVAVYLDQRAQEGGLRWAAAARDPAKAERMLGELGVSAPQTIAADVSEPASLAGARRSARRSCSTSWGPTRATAGP